MYGADQPLDQSSRDVAAGFASYAAVAVGNAAVYAGALDEVEQLRTAMASRAGIEQAKGIIMATRHCTPKKRSTSCATPPVAPTASCETSPKLSSTTSVPDPCAPEVAAAAVGRPAADLPALRLDAGVGHPGRYRRPGACRSRRRLRCDPDRPAGRLRRAPAARPVGHPEQPPTSDCAGRGLALLCGWFLRASRSVELRSDHHRPTRLIEPQEGERSRGGTEPWRFDDRGRRDPSGLAALLPIPDQ
jgi:hypothetical protein